MKPDLQNKWMEAELGSFDDHAAPPPSESAVMAKKLAGAGDFFLAAVRIIVTLFFAMHGAQKLFGLFGGGPVEEKNTVAMGIIEFVGGVALALGALTRPISLLLFSETAWIYYNLCSGGTFWPIPKNGEFSFAYAIFFLLLAMTGPGAISYDRMRRRSR